MKPKFLAQDGKIFALKAVSAGNSFTWQGAGYAEVERPSRMTVDFYEQTTRPQELARAAPAGVQFCRILTRPPQKADRFAAVILTERQFAALYHAVGATPGWWPLADPDFDSRGLFGELESYALFRDGFPIGFGSIERNTGGEAGVNKMVYGGVLPCFQGKGYGGFLFNRRLEAAWQGAAHKVILDTAPEFDVMQGGAKRTPSGEMFAARGFCRTRSETVNFAQIFSGGKLGRNQLNLPGFYAANPLVYSEINLLRELVAAHPGKKVPQEIADVLDGMVASRAEGNRVRSSLHPARRDGSQP